MTARQLQIEGIQNRLQDRLDLYGDEGEARTVQSQVMMIDRTNQQVFKTTFVPKSEPDSQQEALKM